MKQNTVIFFAVFLIPFISRGEQQSKDIHKAHQSIYTKKIKEIVRAQNLMNHSDEKQLLNRLKVSCERRSCSPLEIRTIFDVGQQIIQCQTEHLKSHDVWNKDATSICKTSQTIFGCDSLPSALLRKMCYTGNKYDLKTWASKEMKMKSRAPASIAN